MTKHGGHGNFINRQSAHPEWHFETKFGFCSLNEFLTTFEKQNIAAISKGGLCEIAFNNLKFIKC